jgi:hypothetical protein
VKEPYYSSGATSSDAIPCASSTLAARSRGSFTLSISSSFGNRSLFFSSVHNIDHGWIGKYHEAFLRSRVKHEKPQRVRPDRCLCIWRQQSHHRQRRHQICPGLCFEDRGSSAGKAARTSLISIILVFIFQLQRVLRYQSSFNSPPLDALSVKLLDKLSNAFSITCKCSRFIC